MGFQQEYIIRSQILSKTLFEFQKRHRFLVIQHLLFLQIKFSNQSYNSNLFVNYYQSKVSIIRSITINQLINKLLQKISNQKENLLVIMIQPSSKPRANQNHIKITQIPLSIQVTSSVGIINFLSQNANTIFQKPIIQVQPHMQQITFKNAIGKGSQSQQSDQQFPIRKKLIQKNRIVIKPSNIKRKYFKVDIPVNKGSSMAGVKNFRQKNHFVIQYGNDNKGTLTIVDDIYDSEIDIVNLDNNQSQLTFQEKMKLQDSKLDARRREEKIQVMEEKKDGRKK